MAFQWESLSDDDKVLAAVYEITQRKGPDSGATKGEVMAFMDGLKAGLESKAAKSSNN